MSYSIGQHIYNVRTLLQQYTDDDKPSNRFIFNKLKQNRSQILSQELNKGKLYNTSVYQPINFVPMEMIDRTENSTIKSGNFIYRSKIDLPRLIDSDYGNPPLIIFNLDSTYMIDLLSPLELIANGTRKYKFPGGEAQIINNKLYSNIETFGLKVLGIFASPEEADSLNKTFEYDSCGNVINTVCDTPMLEKEFNIPENLASVIELKTAMDIARFYGYTVEDKTNNGSDDSKVGGKTLNVNKNG